MAKWREGLRDFVDNQKGAIAIIFALALLPMCLVAGAAVDYSLAVRMDSRLHAAADAAALSAARDIAFSPSGRTSAGKDTAHAKGRDIFKNNLRRTQALQDPQIDLSSTEDKGKIVTTAKYAAFVAPYLVKLMGVQRIPLAGSAQASVERPTYKNFFFVVDISSSMALPATKAGIATMRSGTDCALACHDTRAGQSGLSYARSRKVVLRLDVIQETSKDILNYISGSASAVNYFRFSLYTLQHELTPLNGQLGVLSTNYTQLANAVDRIKFTPTDNDPPVAWTYYAQSLSKLLPALPASGDGSTPETAENYVFLMTDGVTDVDASGSVPTFVRNNGVCEYGHCTSPIDPTVCKQFKDKGATVGVVYTTYLDVGHPYDDLVAPFASKIRPNLQSCASPGFFYEGTDGTEISKAMMDLFLSAMGRVRLTD